MNSTSSLYDLDFRNFDPVLGRMHQVDPMAGKYGSTTPYNFSFNNPVSLNDPSGADPFARDDFWREADMQNRTMLNMGTPCNCSNNLVVLNRTHITPGSAGDWMNGNRSMRANFALMSRSTFEDFYNIDLDNPEDRQKVAESLALTPRAAAQFLARLIEGASLSSTGRYVEIPSYRLMYKEGNQLKYRALPSTWLPVGDIFAIATANVNEDQLLVDNFGQLLNVAGVFWGGSELALQTLRQNNAGSWIAKNVGFGFGTQRHAAALKGTFGVTKNVAAKLGTLGYGLSAVMYINAVMGNKKVSTASHVNFGVSTILYGAAFFTAGTVAAPFVAGAALIYGVGQLGSWLYNGKTLEDNIIGN
ncbi:MAG: RHS repeat-associated core domain-containing protein [Bacteroidota bacterium]